MSCTKSVQYLLSSWHAASPSSENIHILKLLYTEAGIGTCCFEMKSLRGETSSICHRSKVLEAKTIESGSACAPVVICGPDSVARSRISCRRMLDSANRSLPIAPEMPLDCPGQST